MADEFDAFLAVALAPEQREPDRAFVARVQAGIRLDRHFDSRPLAGPAGEPDRIESSRLGAAYIGIQIIADHHSF